MVRMRRFGAAPTVSDSYVQVVQDLRYSAGMAKKYEDARAAGLTTSFSADEAVGIAVQSALFQRRLKVKDLAETLGVVSSVASRKIRGEVTWSITDIMRTADLLGVEAATLLPRKAENPGQLVLAGVPVVAGTGFEPVTSGL